MYGLEFWINNKRVRTEFHFFKSLSSHNDWYLKFNFASSFICLNPGDSFVLNFYNTPNNLTQTLNYTNPDETLYYCGWMNLEDNKDYNFHVKELYHAQGSNSQPDLSYANIMLWNLLAREAGLDVVERYSITSRSLNIGKYYTIRALDNTSTIYTHNNATTGIIHELFKHPVYDYYFILYRNHKYEKYGLAHWATSTTDSPIPLQAIYPAGSEVSSTYFYTNNGKNRSGFRAIRKIDDDHYEYILITTKIIRFQLYLPEDPSQMDITAMHVIDYVWGSKSPVYTALTAGDIAGDIKSTSMPYIPLLLYDTSTNKISVVDALVGPNPTDGFVSFDIKAESTISNWPTYMLGAGYTGWRFSTNKYKFYLIATDGIHLYDLTTNPTSETVYPWPTQTTIDNISESSYYKRNNDILYLNWIVFGENIDIPTYIPIHSDSTNTLNCEVEIYELKGLKVSLKETQYINGDDNLAITNDFDLYYLAEANDKKYMYLLLRENNSGIDAIFGLYGLFVSKTDPNRKYFKLLDSIVKLTGDTSASKYLIELNQNNSSIRFKSTPYNFITPFVFFNPNTYEFFYSNSKYRLDPVNLEVTQIGSNYSNIPSLFFKDPSNYNVIYNPISKYIYDPETDTVNSIGFPTHVNDFGYSGAQGYMFFRPLDTLIYDNKVYSNVLIVGAMVKDYEQGKYGLLLIYYDLDTFSTITHKEIIFYNRFSIDDFTFLFNYSIHYCYINSPNTFRAIKAASNSSLDSNLKIIYEEYFSLDPNVSDTLVRTYLDNSTPYNYYYDFFNISTNSKYFVGKQNNYITFLKHVDEPEKRLIQEDTFLEVQKRDYTLALTSSFKLARTGRFLNPAFNVLGLRNDTNNLTEGLLYFNSKQFLNNPTFTNRTLRNINALVWVLPQVFIGSTVFQHSVAPKTEPIHINAIYKLLSREPEPIFIDDVEIAQYPTENNNKLLECEIVPSTLTEENEIDSYVVVYYIQLQKLNIDPVFSKALQYSDTDVRIVSALHNLQHYQLFIENKVTQYDISSNFIDMNLVSYSLPIKRVLKGYKKDVALFEKELNAILMQLLSLSLNIDIQFVIAHKNYFSLKSEISQYNINSANIKANTKMQSTALQLYIHNELSQYKKLIESFDINIKRFSRYQLILLGYKKDCSKTRKDIYTNIANVGFDEKKFTMLFELKNVVRIQNALTCSVSQEVFRFPVTIVENTTNSIVKNILLDGRGNISIAPKELVIFYGWRSEFINDYLYLWDSIKKDFNMDLVKNGLLSLRFTYAKLIINDQLDGIEIEYQEENNTFRKVTQKRFPYL